MDRRTFSQFATLGTAGICSQLAMNNLKAGQLSEAAQSAKSSRSEQASKPPEPVKQPVAVHEYEDLARAVLPHPTFAYISTGSADQITLRENVVAFQRVRVLPPLLRGVSQPDLATTALGQRISLPVILAPVAAQRLFHPDGGLAAARAATDAGTIFGVSSSVLNSVEEISRASTGPKWFQLYAPKDRAIGQRLVQRAEKAGFRAIILTVDLGEWKDSDRRNRFSLPREMLINHLRDFGFSADFEQMTDDALNAFNASVWDMGMTWEILDWLRNSTRLPIILKGVLRPDDARRAAEIGLEGIVVSNHGGRRLDGMPATIDVVEDVAKAVAGRAEIYMDGGVRRGTDILKALAFGARAVLIGRPYAWALAAAGEAGVKNILELLRAEFANAMSACGCSDTSKISRDLVTHRIDKE